MVTLTTTILGHKDGREVKVVMKSHQYAYICGKTDRDMSITTFLGELGNNLHDDIKIYIDGQQVKDHDFSKISALVHTCGWDDTVGGLWDVTVDFNFPVDSCTCEGCSKTDNDSEGNPHTWWASDYSEQIVKQCCKAMEDENERILADVKSGKAKLVYG